MKYVFGLVLASRGGAEFFSFNKLAEGILECAEKEDVGVQRLRPGETFFASPPILPIILSFNVVFEPEGFLYV